MKNSARYRAHGLECERLALKTTSDSERVSWLQMAADWQARAHAAELTEPTTPRFSIM